MSRRRHRKHNRRGAAAVEAAILLPILTFIVLGVCELGWFVYCAQVVHNAARQGARVAARHENSNSQVETAVQIALDNSSAVDPDAVTVRISRLSADGQEQYQVFSLSDNENGQAVRVSVSVDYSEMGFATNILGLKDETLSSQAVMRRLK